MLVAAAAIAGFNGSHFQAFLSALVAGLGALLAMLVLVLGAFIAARLTNLSAQGAEFRREVTAA